MAEFPVIPEFSASLQSSESHDPSEITRMHWFGTQETLLIVMNVENSHADRFFFPSVFCENVILFFRILLKYRNFKRGAFL